MKNINQYIVEKLKINKSKLKASTELTLFPETKEELKKMIKEEIKNNGNKCSLNHIDVSKILDISYLFSNTQFNGDISEWDVSNVTNMIGLFEHSIFDQDISDWDVSNVKNMSSMFYDSKFNQPIGNWDVSNVRSMYHMFVLSKFNQDISKWKINPNCKIIMIFTDSKIKDSYKPKLPNKQNFPTFI